MVNRGFTSVIIKPNRDCWYFNHGIKYGIAAAWTTIMKKPQVWIAVILLLGVTGCATPTPLYEPAVAEKPREDDGYRGDLSDCKFYAAQTQLGVIDYFGAGGMYGAQHAQVRSSNGQLNDVVDNCMRSRGYRVL
jgi:hypothetical protein